MRHFSGEFEGLQLLMLDELEAISGGDGEDTDDGSGPPPGSDQEIIVNGFRIDQTDRDEQLMERQWLVNGAYLGWCNAELINGGWTITSATAPTEDQKAFKSNYDQVHGVFWGSMTDTQQAALASELTDAGVDVAGSNINLVNAYHNYEALLESGAVQGSTARDFAIWVQQGGR